MRVFIIDDELPAVRLLTKFVEKTDGLILVKATTDALTGIGFINKGGTDLLLLDIEMPDIKGIDLIAKLDSPPMIIFTTAYQEYALDGYDLDIVDYLLKPIPYDRFLKAIQRAKNQFELNKDTAKIALPKSIRLTIDYMKVDINYDDILYIEGLKDYVKIYTAKGLRLTRLNIKGILTIIEHPKLIRVHRSYIVNMDKVTAANKSTLHLGDKHIPIGKSYRKEVMNFCDS